MKIRVERVSDTHECEVCGDTWAEGAVVYIDDQVTLDLVPSAHCYDGTNYDDSEILIKILEYLGHTVEFE